MSSKRDAINMFEFLDRTHQDIQRHLVMLREVVDTVEATGINPAVRAKALEVLSYFNTEARHHHLDEEKHVFPALLVSQDEALVAATRRLIQDHGWLEENWLYIEPSISAVSAGNAWFDTVELRHALEVFETLYLDHVMLEESLVYPQAKVRLQAYDKADMGREMARRRSQTPK